MVDIDDVVTDLARIHLKDWHQGLFDDKRVEVINGDALAYWQLQKSFLIVSLWI